MFTNKPNATKGTNSVEHASKALLDLPANIRQRLDADLRTSEDWDNGNSPLANFEASLTALLRDAHSEKAQFWSGSGPSVKRGANVIAHEMARVCVLGTGKMPTYGTEFDSKEPSTVFARAVKDMFEELGVDHTSWNLAVAQLPC